MSAFVSPRVNPSFLHKPTPAHSSQLAVSMLTYFLDAHADKLKTIPLRTNPQVGKFEGKSLFDLVEYGSLISSPPPPLFLPSPFFCPLTPI